MQVLLAAGETLDAESSEEESEGEEESGGDDLSEGEEVRFDAPWSREEGAAAEQGGALWDRRSFAHLAEGSDSSELSDAEDDQESSSDSDSDGERDGGSSNGSSSESDSDAEDPDAGPPLR